MQCLAWFFSSSWITLSGETTRMLRAALWGSPHGKKLGPPADSQQEIEASENSHGDTFGSEYR